MKTNQYKNPETGKISSILSQNAKLKKTSKETGYKVFNFGIPAHVTKNKYFNPETGKKQKIVICKNAKECIKFCYANNGAYSWSTVFPAFETRYLLTLDKNFIDIMVNTIKAKKVDFLRVHDSGDYYSKKYLLNWFEIAKQLPNVYFYSYTNMVQLVKENKNHQPTNYSFIFSDSGKQKNLIDKTVDRHTKIFNSENELKKAGYINASKVDLFASSHYNRENNKIGLILH